jgi:hypothetical protein
VHAIIMTAIFSRDLHAYQMGLTPPAGGQTALRKHERKSSTPVDEMNSGRSFRAVLEPAMPRCPRKVTRGTLGRHQGSGETCRRGDRFELSRRRIQSRQSRDSPPAPAFDLRRLLRKRGVCLVNAMQRPRNALISL